MSLVGALPKAFLWLLLTPNVPGEELQGFRAGQAEGSWKRWGRGKEVAEFPALKPSSSDSLLLVLIPLEAEGQAVAVSGFAVEPGVFLAGLERFPLVPELRDGAAPGPEGCEHGMLLDAGLAAASPPSGLVLG